MGKANDDEEFNSYEEIQNHKSKYNRYRYRIKYLTIAKSISLVGKKSNDRFNFLSYNIESGVQVELE